MEKETAIQEALSLANHSGIAVWEGHAYACVIPRHPKIRDKDPKQRAMICVDIATGKVVRGWLGIQGGILLMAGLNALLGLAFLGLRLTRSRYTQSSSSKIERSFSFACSESSWL